MSADDVIKLMVYMFPGLLCFLVFYLFSDRKISVYLNMTEVFFYTVMIRLISSKSLYSALLAITFGILLNLLYQNDRFYTIFRFLRITKKNFHDNVLFSYLHNNQRSALITLKSGDVVQGFISHFNHTDSNIILTAPVWLNRKIPAPSSDIIYHLYLDSSDISLIEFILNEEDKKSLMKS